MNDLRTLLPHSRKGKCIEGSGMKFIGHNPSDTKLDRKDKLPVINEVMHRTSNWCALNFAI